MNITLKIVLKIALNIALNITHKLVRKVNGTALAGVIGVFAMLPCASVFAQTNENWTEVNLSVVDNQVLPHYVELKRSSLQLADMSASFCVKPDEESLNDFKLGYHEAMDAWQAIQHVQFGPITYFNWNFRLQFWPDEKGTGGRQLTALIAGKNEAVLSMNSFARQSIGIQGFPALERLLFSADSLEDFQEDSYRCQVAQTIATNISEIAEGVQSRWQDEFRSIVANADDSDDFESAEDATIDFLKALVESVPRIIDQKLTPVLGESFSASRIRRAESWRSERSLRNIKINLNILAQLFSGADSAVSNDVVLLNSVLLAEDVVIIDDIFIEINSTLVALPDSLATSLATEESYASLLALQEQLQTLDDALESALKNTDLYLGFNSLDGD